MGLTAIASSAASSASSASGAASGESVVSMSIASLTVPVGPGIGGVLVTAAVILLLAYFDVLNTMEDANESVRTTLVASIVPLMIVFVGVVVFQTISYL